MYEVAIVNPRGSKRRRRNRKGQFVKGSSAPSRRRRRRRSAVAATSAPRRRRRRAVARISNPRRKRRTYVSHFARRRRRNPRANFSVGGVARALVPAGIGAVGAVALDVLMGYAPLPVALKTGIPRHAVRIAGAIGLGLVAGKFFGGEKGKLVGAGALTVALYSIIRETVQKFAPTLPGLGDYEEVTVGYMDPASTVQLGTGAYMNGMDSQAIESGMSAYMDGMGAYMQDGIAV